MNETQFNELRYSNSFDSWTFRYPTTEMKATTLNLDSYILSSNSKFLLKAKREWNKVSLKQGYGMIIQ